MAVIHRGRHDPRRAMRRARTLMLLCWPMAALSVVMTVMLYVQSGTQLLSLASAWQGSFLKWAVEPRSEAVFGAAWISVLWQAAEVLLRGVGWLIFGLTLALPGLLAVGLAVLGICLFRPVREKYRVLRARVRAIDSALRLLSSLPDSCHVFLYRYISFDGGAIRPEVLLAGPGGVVAAEVRSEPGIIEGCVTDASLRRVLSDGDVEKLRNPARKAVSLVTQLGAFFASQEICVRVIPCVIFVHPDASVYVNPADPLNAGGRRAHISSCVITDAVSFWDDLGREYASGRLLPQGMVDSILGALRNAPECAVEE